MTDSPQGPRVFDEVAVIFGRIFEKCQALKALILAGSFRHEDVTLIEDHLFIALDGGMFAYVNDKSEFASTAAPRIPTRAEDVEGMPVAQLRPLEAKLDSWLAEIQTPSA